MMIRSRAIPSSFPQLPAQFAGLAIVCLTLAACSSSPPPQPSQPQVTSNGRGIYKVGKPYEVEGVWYYPSENPDYDEKGIASWYGPNFHEKFTGNGEIFDQNEVSAAHRTLPLPSIVRVTNLENGRSIEVRVNDRGPFSKDRIIDLSRRGAQLLGFEREGTTEVEVKYLVPESMQAQSLARMNGEEGGSEGAPEPPPPAIASASVDAESLPPVPQAGSGAAHSVAGSSLPPPPRMPSYAAIGTDTGPQDLAPLPASTRPLPELPQTVSYQPVGPNHIFIQAGAFADGDNALRMRDRLAGLGAVTVEGVQVNGMNVYRVRLGPIATVADADDLLTKARAAGASEARIVVK